MEFSICLGKVLCHYRDKKKLSQTDLAAIVDMERTTISAIENGHSNISMNTFLKLSKGLEIDPRIILSDALNRVEQ